MRFFSSSSLTAGEQRQQHQVTPVAKSARAPVVAGVGVALILHHRWARINWARGRSSLSRVFSLFFSRVDRPVLYRYGTKTGRFVFICSVFVGFRSGATTACLKGNPTIHIFYYSYCVLNYRCTYENGGSGGDFIGHFLCRERLLHQGGAGERQLVQKTIYFWSLQGLVWP